MADFFMEKNIDRVNAIKVIETKYCYYTWLIT